MIDPNAFLGNPIEFKNICKIYPPKVNDILQNKNYPIYKKLFLSSQEDIEDEYVEKKLGTDFPTPLEYLFQICSTSEKIKQAVIEGFQFFIKEPVLLLSDQKMIVIGDMNEILPQLKKVSELRIIQEENFFEFQNTLRLALGEKKADPYNANEHPKIKYFKAKARMRDKVKQQSKDGLNFGSLLASICCMGLGITPLNIGELTLVAITNILRYYQEKYKYEIDIQSLMAGASSEKLKPNFWIRNIED